MKRIICDTCDVLSRPTCEGSSKFILIRELKYQEYYLNFIYDKKLAKSSTSFQKIIMYYFQLIILRQTLMPRV